MTDLLKKKLWGFNVVGAQGVNAKNDIEVGVTGNMGVYYDGLPAIRIGNKLFTPLGNVIEGEGDDDFKFEERVPDVPEDAWEDGQNYILGLDENSEVAWIKFPNLPEDFDEKNYVLALDNEGEMIWKEETDITVPYYIPVTFSGFSRNADADYEVNINNNEIKLNHYQSFDGDASISSCTVMLKAGDVVSVILVGEGATLNGLSMTWVTKDGTMHGTDKIGEGYDDGFTVGTDWTWASFSATVTK